MNAVVVDMSSAGTQAPAPEYRFGVLGPFELHRDGEPHHPVRTKSRLLLALLLINAGRQVSVEHLVAELWTRPPRSAVANLRTAVRDLRMIITGVDTLVTQTHGYELRLPAESIDLRRYERLVAAGNAALDRTDPRTAVELFTEADGLWRGSAFEGLRQSPTLVAVAEAAETLRLNTTEVWAQARLELGGDPTLITDLRRHLATHPLRERCWETLIRAIAASGDVETALRTYQEARTHLAEQLGIDPGPRLHELHLAVLNRDPSVVPPTDRRVDIARPAVVASPEHHHRPRPAQLPAEVSGFIGRAEQLRHLRALLDRELGPDREHDSGRDIGQDAGHDAGQDVGRELSTIVTVAISGCPGVGKTALAVRFAHQVRDRFPDGQLYANLRGFSPAGSIATPGEVLGGFLESLGIPAEQIPTALDARAALFRSMLFDRRVLILLDNAHSAEQIRPLLPATPGCLVIVTSRTHLTGLIALDGAHPVALDVFTDDEAHELLARRVSAERLAAKPAAVAEIIAGCARLPLALTVAAAYTAFRPGFPLGALAARLRDPRTRLDALATDDPTSDVRSVFSWSYRTLTPQAARLFRLLGLPNGPDIDAGGASRLAGTSPEETRLLLAELTRAHMLAEHAPGRYWFHDLLRAYATELTNTTDDTTERSAAIHRLLDHLLRVGHRTNRVLCPTLVAATPQPSLHDAVA